MKTWKALFTADTHLSNSLPHSRPTGPTGVTDRFLDQTHAMTKIRDIAIKEKAQDVIILGDLWDRRLLDAITLQGTMNVLRSFHPIKVHILPGNHDANSVLAQRFLVEVFREELFRHVSVLSTGYPWSPVPWITFWPIAFKPQEVAKGHVLEAREKAVALRKKTGGQQYLLTHQSILGAEHLGWKCDDGLEPDFLSTGFDWVFTGHFHKAQFISDSKGRYVGEYLGGPWQRDFGERGYDCAVKVVTFEKTKHRKPDPRLPPPFGSSRHFLGAPEFFVFNGFDEVEKVPAGSFVRVIVEASHPRWIELQHNARALREKLAADGIRAQVIHQPLAHHSERLTESTEKTRGYDFKKLVDHYVKSEDVCTEGLDQDWLVELGREILEEVGGAK